jgi:protein ImuB
MFACLYAPDFAVQAALLTEPPDLREGLRRSPMVVLEGPENLPRVAALNDAARKCGMEAGMTKLQVETCGGVLLRKRSEAEEDAAQAELVECATFFSPRVESTGAGTVLLDLDGTERLFGTPENTARKISVAARERGFDLRVAVASNPDTALYAARGFPGITVILAGQEARRLAWLNVELLPIGTEMLDTLHCWGIRTFQALAALPEVPLTERLGQAGLYLQKLARGAVHRTLVPIAVVQQFVESYEFDDPVETLESLSFVLNRLLQQICSRLMAQALSTNELRLTMDLAVTQRRVSNSGEQFQHDWKLPVPTQDGRMLFALVWLELERNIFSAPIKKVTLEALAVKPRTAQGNLFAPPSPDAEKLEMTLARIRGVVGGADAEGVSCVGSPGVVDTHKTASFEVRPFSSVREGLSKDGLGKDAAEKDRANLVPALLPTIALRVFRPPLETAVELNGQTPHIVCLWKKPGRVIAASGPWCSSGHWWNRAVTWVREEWDVALKTPAGIGFYRIYLDRVQKQWFVEGMFD